MECVVSVLEVSRHRSRLNFENRRDSPITMECVVRLFFFRREMVLRLKIPDFFEGWFERLTSKCFFLFLDVRLKFSHTNSRLNFLEVRLKFENTCLVCPVDDLLLKQTRRIP